MYKNKKILAVIPARGGSKGIRKKNIKLLNGRPLIYYTIKQAKRSRYIDRIIVTTEDPDIALIARKYNIDIIKRSKKLAKDDTPMLPVLKEVVKKAGHYDHILLLQPTSPLRKAEHIDQAIRKLPECDSVVSVRRLGHSQSNIVKIKKDRLSMTTKKIATRRQDSKLYLINGAVYLMKKDILMRQAKSVFGGDTRAIIMDDISSIDIDNEKDWILASHYLKNVYKKR